MDALISFLLGPKPWYDQEVSPYAGSEHVQRTQTRLASQDPMNAVKVTQIIK